MAAKIEVYRSKNGEFRFRLKAANGQIIAQGQRYTTNAACMNGIESVTTNAATAEVVEVEEWAPAGPRARRVGTRRAGAAHLPPRRGRA